MYNLFHFAGYVLHWILMIRLVINVMSELSAPKWKFDNSLSRIMLCDYVCFAGWVAITPNIKFMFGPC